MKGRRAVFLAIACSALMPATGARPRTTPHQQTPVASSSDTAPTGPAGVQQNSADAQRGWEESDGNRPISRSSSTKAHDARQVPNPSDRPIPGNTKNSHQPASVRPHSNEVRHTGSNPAIVSGSKGKSAKNASSIDGTQMNRKP
jgi:hypothetical protein